MTREEAIEQLKLTRAANKCNYADKYILDAFDMAIRSLEAWEKVEKEINESISICREDAQNNDWYDGELAGFLQCKDIIDGNLSEVENDT